MNPNAKEFKFNAGASTWTPGQSFVPAAPAAAAPAPVAVVPPPAPEPEAVAAEGNGDEEEEIDENDPLWIATLKVTNGDRKAAVKLLENPDELMIYPEIKAILEGGSAAEDESWETQANTEPVVEKVAAKVEKVTISEPESGASTPVRETTSTKTDADEEPVEEVAFTDVDPREHLNIVTIGHVDAGKSTLSGSILFLMGMVDQRTIEKFEREAKQRNRESWFLAFILDTSEDERAKGITVEVGRAHFETAVNRYTILDAPGHKNYVPNMIAGCSQADVGVLVISARKGEFETGFEKGGQTREHALLAKTLGVQHLVVVINKMDDPTVEWEQARFEECVAKLKPFLKSCGFTIKTEVKFVPISALSGDNVLKEVAESRCSWWKQLYTSGAHNTTTSTFIGTLDSLVVGNRNPDAPLRIPVLDRYFERGVVVLGKVESGTLRIGDEVVIAPTKKRVKVEEIFIGEAKVRSAKPGENVLIKFQCAVEDFQKGFVLCHASNLCPGVIQIEVQLMLVELLEHRPIFTTGYEAVMHVHTVEIEVVVRALASVLIDGKKTKRPFARTGQQCVAVLEMPLHTCMETFEKYPSMARVTLRDEGRTIAIGKILRLGSK